MDAIYGKLVTSAVEAAAKKTEKTATPLESGESPFKQMLSQMDTGGEQMANMVGLGNEDMSLGSGQMDAISAENIELNPTDLKTGLEEPKGMEKIVDMLSDVNKGQMQMDNMVNEILYSGKRFSNQELLAIQAQVFHFAQMTELTVKVTEQGVTGVKTVLNTQVQ